MIIAAKSDIGFGKKIKGSWLDDSLRHVAVGHAFSQAKGELTETIRVDNPGEEAIRKVLSCLNRVWFNPPHYCRTTRDAAVAIYQGSDSPEHDSSQLGNDDLGLPIRWQCCGGGW